MDLQPVGELQACEQSRAARHHKRALDLSLPAPLDSPDTGADARLPSDEPTQLEGRSQSGKRKRARVTDSEQSSFDKSVSPLADGSFPQRPSSERADISTEDQPLPSTDDGNALNADRTIDPGWPLLLPAQKVFPIQIGSELFRLSGVSLSSDGPSYFTQYFDNQLKSGTNVDDVRTLYIDRDPETFRDIALHLQGYHIEPRDGTHFVRLFADSLLFSLPRLTSLLYKSTIFIRVGDQEFKIPRDLFSGPGDTPNYFSLGFSIFFTRPANAFGPSAKHSALLRPPSILPPHVPNRCARVFQDLLECLKGYGIHIRDESHRDELLRDARYYHFKGLEQRLVRHRIAHSQHRGRSEITIGFDDLKTCGISYRMIPSSGSGGDGSSSNKVLFEATVTYARPHIDEQHHDLIVELGPHQAGLRCSLDSPLNMLVPLDGPTRAQFQQLCKTLCKKVDEDDALVTAPHGAGGPSSTSPPTRVEVSQMGVVASLDKNAHVVIDGHALDWVNVEEGGHNDLTQLWIASQAGRMGCGGGGGGAGHGDEDGDEGEEGAGGLLSEEEIAAHTTEDWVVHRSLWRIGVRVERGSGDGGRPVLGLVWEAVKVDASTSLQAENRRRAFL